MKQYSENTTYTFVIRFCPDILPDNAESPIVDCCCGSGKSFCKVVVGGNSKAANEKEFLSRILEPYVPWPGLTVDIFLSFIFLKLVNSHPRRS